MSRYMGRTLSDSSGSTVRRPLSTRETVAGDAPDLRATSRGSPGAGDEAFAVEHRRHDPPAEAVEHQQQYGEADGQTESGMDDVVRDERRHRDRRETREHAELLRDPDIARSRRDGDADPDRPGGEERREEQLRDQRRDLEQRRRHGRIREEPDAGENKGVDRERDRD